MPLSNPFICSLYAHMCRGVAWRVCVCVWRERTCHAFRKLVGKIMGSTFHSEWSTLRHHIWLNETYPGIPAVLSPVDRGRPSRWSNFVRLLPGITAWVVQPIGPLTTVPTGNAKFLLSRTLILNLKNDDPWVNQDKFLLLITAEYKNLKLNILKLQETFTLTFQQQKNWPWCHLLSTKLQHIF